jgi:hypothetical protein
MAFAVLPAHAGATISFVRFPGPLSREQVHRVFKAICEHAGIPKHKRFVHIRVQDFGTFKRQR